MPAFDFKKIKNLSFRIFAKTIAKINSFIYNKYVKY
jgi:hypothetical protein